MARAAESRVRHAESSVPPADSRKTLATVNGEPITLDEFAQQLSFLHRGAKEDGTAIHRQEPYELLDRLINIRLILLEGRTMGLDQLPDVKTSMDVYRRDALVSTLLGNRARTVTKGDEAEVQRIYKDAVRECKLTSILVTKEEDAKALEAKLRAGGRFEALASKLVAEGKAQTGERGEYLKVKDMLPDVKQIVSSMKVGEVSPLVKIGPSYAVFSLEDVRLPVDPAAREQAEKDAIALKRSTTVKQYTESLKAQYAKIDRTLLDRLDYGPGSLDRLMKDSRALAQVKGETPITVADLSEALKAKFFHGMDRAMKSKKVDQRKGDVLDDLVTKRVLVKEAKRQGLQSSEQYKAMIKEYENGLIFGTFVDRVIDPDIKLDDAELKKYLAGHSSDYTTPEMIRLDGIAFRKRQTAEDALAKLRKGADFKWMRANAEGQVDPKTTDGLLQFSPGPVVTSSLPPDVRKAVSGAATGDCRYYGGADGPFYILRVSEVIRSRPQAFEDVKETLLKTVFEEKREDAVKEWAKKLRSSYRVKTFVTRETLHQILGLGSPVKQTAG